MYRSFTRGFSTTRPIFHLSRLSVIGRIGSDLVEKTGKSGTAYLRYSLAVQTGREETSWFNISVFDEQAINFMKNYLKKGSAVYVEADASIHSYERDGQTFQSLNLVQRSLDPLWFRKARTDTDEEAGAGEGSFGADQQ